MIDHFHFAQRMRERRGVDVERQTTAVKAALAMARAAGFPYVQPEPYRDDVVLRWEWGREWMEVRIDKTGKADGQIAVGKKYVVGNGGRTRIGIVMQHLLKLYRERKGNRSGSRSPRVR